MRRIPFLLLLILVSCKTNPPPDPGARRAELLASYDRYLRDRIASFPGLGLKKDSSPAEIEAAAKRARGLLAADLGISESPPKVHAKEYWSGERAGLRVEAFRISYDPPADTGGIPAILYLPPKGEKVLSGIVLAPGMGQSKHDFLSQAACGVFARTGAACLAIDLLGEGERSPTPGKRSRGLLEEDAIARSLDTGRPLLGIFIQDLRAGLSFLQIHPETKGKRLAVGGYSLGGWMTLLLGAIDPRPAVLLSTSNIVVPSEISGAKGAGWRVPGIFEHVRPAELLALAAKDRTILWMNGENDRTFIEDDKRRYETLQALSLEVREIYGVEEDVAGMEISPGGGHLPYHFAPEGLEKLFGAGLADEMKARALSEPVPLASRLAEIKEAADPAQWPAELFTAAYVPAEIPFISYQAFLTGSEVFQQLPLWLSEAEEKARARAVIPEENLPDWLKVRLDRDFDSLVRAARWTQKKAGEWEDSPTGLRALETKGTGEGLIVAFAQPGTFEQEKPSRADGFATHLLFEVLPYSDNEPAAGTTAAGETLAAVLSFLAMEPFVKFEDYQADARTGDLPIYLALLDPRARMIRTPAPLPNRKAVTGFHLEGHVPGVTGIFPREKLLEAALRKSK